MIRPFLGCCTKAQLFDTKSTTYYINSMWCKDNPPHMPFYIPNFNNKCYIIVRSSVWIIFFPAMGYGKTQWCYYGN